MKFLGTLIIVEGIAGCGKTTLVEMLKNKFNQAGLETEVIVASGNNDTARQVRQVLMQVNQDIKNGLFKESSDRTHAAKMLCIDLLLANIWNAMIGFAIPAITQGKVVLMDRYIYSTLGHQAEDHTLREYITRCWEAKVYRLGTRLSELLISPDCLINMDVSAQVSLDRFNKRDSNIQDKAIRKLDSIGSSDLADKIAFIERYQHGYKVYPPVKQIDLNMNDFATTDYTELDKMIESVISTIQKRKEHAQNRESNLTQQRQLT